VKDMTTNEYKLIGIYNGAQLHAGYKALNHPLNMPERFSPEQLVDLDHEPNPWG